MSRRQGFWGFWGSDREPTVEERYSIAQDALESGNRKRATKLVLELREEFPDAKVPYSSNDDRNVRALIPFDEDQVRIDFTEQARIDKDFEDFELEEQDHFGVTTFVVTVGRQEWRVVRDEDAAEELALARITEDLKHEPEIFSPSFLEQHIDLQKLKKFVYDVRYEDDYIDELDDRDFWRMAEQYGVDVPEVDEDDEDAEPPDRDDYTEQVKEAYAEDAAKDPMEFFRDMYGRDEAMAEAIKVAGIDVESAARDALRSDGWQHFVSSYDGNSSETHAAGFVYWREN